MEAKPIIKHGWMRAILFALTFMFFLIVVNIATARILGPLFGVSKTSGETGSFSELTLLISVSISLAISVLIVYFFRKLIDKQDLVSLGLPLKNNLSHAIAGLSLALLLLGTGTLLLLGGGNLHWTGINFGSTQLITGLVVMIMVAFAEELVFRGYILHNLMLSMNKWLALVYSALLFALFHLNNPGINVLAMINVFLAGLLLGINYIFTKNLWYGIFFHFGWNFYQGAVLGYKVSGVPLKSLFEQELHGNQLLTGGPFGFEGSLLASILSLVALLLLTWVYKRKYEA